MTKINAIGASEAELDQLDERFSGGLTVLLDEFHRLLADETDPMQQVGARTRMLEIEQALSGDPTFTALLANGAVDELLHRREISISTRVWLAVILSRIAGNKDAARLVSGKRSRGAPKNGVRAYKVAIDVAMAVRNGAKSMEDAWVETAEGHHLDPSTVKSYWIQWKPAIEKVMRAALDADQVADMSALLSEQAKRNRMEK